MMKNWDRLFWRALFRQRRLPGSPTPGTEDEIHFLLCPRSLIAGSCRQLIFQHWKKSPGVACNASQEEWFYFFIVHFDTDAEKELHSTSSLGVLAALRENSFPCSGFRI